MKKILLTGGYGFLGSHVAELLETKGYETIKFRSSEYNLTNEDEVFMLIQKFQPDAIIHMAARLGGIGDNNENPALYFEDNMRIGLNVLKVSAILKINKIINIGTVCSYPRDLKIPFREDELWNGFPEGTNSAYGIAKRALVSYSEALNKQYKLNTINLLLANLYGPKDDFREETSHVIPALIRKIDFAKQNNLDSILVWGDGSPTRDFLHVNDAAKGIVNALESNIDGKANGPINIASGVEISIKQLVIILKKLMDFDGSIIFDKTKPNGQPKRLLDISKSKLLLNYEPSYLFENGLKESVLYYLNNKEFILNQKIKYKKTTI